MMDDSDSHDFLIFVQGREQPIWVQTGSAMDACLAVARACRPGLRIDRCIGGNPKETVFPDPIALEQAVCEDLRARGQMEQARIRERLLRDGGAGQQAPVALMLGGVRPAKRAYTYDYRHDRSPAKPIVLIPPELPVPVTELDDKVEPARHMLSSEAEHISRAMESWAPWARRARFQRHRRYEGFR